MDLSSANPGLPKWRARSELPDLSKLSIDSKNARDMPAPTHMYRMGNNYDPYDSDERAMGDLDDTLTARKAEQERKEELSGFKRPRQRDQIYKTPWDAQSARDLQNLKELEERVGEAAVAAARKSDEERRSIGIRYVWDAVEDELYPGVEPPMTPDLKGKSWEHARWSQIVQERDTLVEGIKVLTRRMVVGGKAVVGVQPKDPRDGGVYWRCADLLETMMNLPDAKHYGFNAPYVQRNAFSVYEANEYDTLVPGDTHKDFKTIQRALAADLQPFKQKQYTSFQTFAKDMRLVAFNAMRYHNNKPMPNQPIDIEYEAARRLLTGGSNGRETVKYCIDRALCQIEFEEFDAARAVDVLTWSQLSVTPEKPVVVPRVRWIRPADMAYLLLLDVINHPCSVALSPKYLQPDAKDPEAATVYNEYFVKAGAKNLDELNEVLKKVYTADDAILRLETLLSNTFKAAKRWYRDHTTDKRSSDEYMPRTKLWDFVDILDRCFIYGWNSNVSTDGIPRYLGTLSRIQTIKRIQSQTAQQMLVNLKPNVRWDQDVVRIAFSYLSEIQRNVVLIQLMVKHSKQLGIVQHAHLHYTLDLNSVTPDDLADALLETKISNTRLTWGQMWPRHLELNVDGVRNLPGTEGIEISLDIKDQVRSCPNPTPFSSFRTHTHAHAHAHAHIDANVPSCVSSIPTCQPLDDSKSTRLPSTRSTHWSVERVT